jgi:hypothetical protein
MGECRLLLFIAENATCVAWPHTLSTWQCQCYSNESCVDRWKDGGAEANLSPLVLCFSLLHLLLSFWKPKWRQLLSGQKLAPQGSQHSPAVKGWSSAGGGGPVLRSWGGWGLPLQHRRGLGACLLGLHFPRCETTPWTNKNLESLWIASQLSRWFSCMAKVANYALSLEGGGFEKNNQVTAHLRWFLSNVGNFPLQWFKESL